jgi:predicted DNA-binding protein (MmcQ/YjbR family)
MRRADAVKYCLSKPGAYLDSPWGPDHDVAKVGGKIFCFFGSLETVETAGRSVPTITVKNTAERVEMIATAGRSVPTITVKNTAERVEMWRTRFPDHIGTGPYLNKALWNRVITRGPGAPDSDDVRELIDDSYDLIVAKLPKSARPAT